MSKTYVYKITREDGLEYIGVTKDVKSRMYAHKKSLRFSKSTIKNVNILRECDSYESALYFEKMHIEIFDTYKNGLNVTPSGQGKNIDCKFNTLGFVYSEESRNKMKKNHWSKTKKYTPKGFKHSFETKEKWSQKRKGVVWGPVKISKNVALEIQKNYKEDLIHFDMDFLKPLVKKSSRDNLENIEIGSLISPNGRKITKKLLYSIYYSEKYRVTHGCITKIIEGNRLYDKFSL